MGMELAAEASGQVWATSAAASEVAASQSATQWLERQMALVKIAAAPAFDPFQFIGSAARVMRDGLTPIHDRVTANARRLEALES